MPSSSQMLPSLYKSLRLLARKRINAESAGISLQATALVHEALLRLGNPSDQKWDSEAHFCGAAAIAMRRVLIDRARRNRRLKHGSGLIRISLDEAQKQAYIDSRELLALDHALTRLAAVDKRKAQVAEYRYFGGLTIAETATVLSISPTTVKADWAFARAWLQREIARSAGIETLAG